MKLYIVFMLLYNYITYGYLKRPYQWLVHRTRNPRSRDKTPLKCCKLFSWCFILFIGQRPVHFFLTAGWNKEAVSSLRSYEASTGEPRNAK